MSRTDKWHWRKQTRERRLRIEPLEDRRMLAVITVQNDLDDTLANLAGDGQLSLREAIEIANNPGTTIDGFSSNDVADTIEFASLLFDTPQTIALAGVELEIAETLTISGPGRDELTIDAQQHSRVLNFSALTGDLTLDGLTLTGGKTTSDNTYLGGGQVETTHSGGGIRFNSSGTLSLTQSTLSGNSTTGIYARGGGIFTSTGAVTLTQSTLSGNSTTEYSASGGGIFTYSGAVTLTKSTLSGNSTAGDFADGGGIRSWYGSVALAQSTLSGNSTAGDYSDGGGISSGGISTYLGSGAVMLTQSTLSDNSTTGSQSHGGGIFALHGTVTLTNSTVSDNYTAGFFAHGGGIRAVVGAVILTQSTLSGNWTEGDEAHGGGIYTNTGPVTVTSSTVTDNDASATGGGIWNQNAPIVIENSIVAGNTAGSGNPDFRQGTGTLDVDFSLIGDTSGLTAQQLTDILSGTGNLTNIDAMLAPLADNGGPTLPNGAVIQTHALLTGSLAIDAGDPNFTSPPDFDQRGLPFVRVFDGDGAGGPRIDMGAFEVGPPLPGDYNGDGIVDAIDYVFWRDRLDRVVTPFDGADGNGNGIIDDFDYEIWRANYGATLLPAALALQATVGDALSSIFLSPTAKTQATGASEQVSASRSSGVSGDELLLLAFAEQGDGAVLESGDWNLEEDLSDELNLFKTLEIVFAEWR